MILGNINKFTHDVPAFIVIADQVQKLIPGVEEHVNAWKLLHCDIGIAAQNICLEALDQGLATCVIGGFFEAGIKDLLNIPEDRNVTLVIAIGYPVHKTVRSKVRRSLEDIVGVNQY